MSKSVLDLSKEFAGRRALVTGGTRGIGVAIAQRLLDGGATVVVTARSTSDEAPKGAKFIKGDVSTNEGAKAIAAATLQVLGGIDIIINNAGAARVHLQGTASIPDAEWQDALDMNFLSAVRVTNALLPALKESKAGAIVNLSSGGATSWPGPLGHYGAAKAALNVYSKTVARELAPLQIRVNTVTPGTVTTPGGDAIRKTLTDAMGAPPEAIFATIPLGRPGQPSEIAEVVALLVSDRGQWITGHNYFVDGGMLEI
jgi:NAD(P)-dependent dehydrogenase (short-subunit alcohol dehydrogenase family)